MSEQGRTDVSEITGWHTHNEVVSLAKCLHACVGIEIVESLRQESGHIDAVG